MITPDTKDWTWVLRRPCPECGYDASTVRAADVPALLRENAATWRPVLTAGPDPRVRPAPQVWSPLEYACHVRDACRVFDERLRLMLTEDDPHYPNWDQDRAAVEDRYGEQDPATVATELLAAAEALATRFAGVTGDAWQRTGRRSDGAHFTAPPRDPGAAGFPRSGHPFLFTVDTFARYFLHDPVHHRYDVSAERIFSA
ncbi:DinB family protein [Actinophytocola sp.]|uniref:DinB family protein n=1 Tax=Actinophytocola sp. TaxID=1872138 RepID=UPI002D80DC26|nr:DinB family protein [Actinophytocola sp.]HET9141273.1 DinB family protein [Actinophytocola sp.]